MVEEQDPFDVFGDEDSDEDESNLNTSPVGRQLVDQANARLQQDERSSTTTKLGARESPGAGTSAGGDNEIMQNFKRLEINWPPPIYLGPMILVSELPFGGGRGYVASKKLDPGTLVLVEEPMLEWPSEQLGSKLDLITVQHILENSNASKIVKDMEEFHPTKKHVDNDDAQLDHAKQVSEMMQTLRKELPHETINALVEIANRRCIRCGDSSPIRSVDIIRMFLALRYNGLESGVYRHVAMLNHDCFPNCTKLQPARGVSYSEVRTTRPVAAGESITISYLPRVLSHASRRKYLWDQHRFDIGATLKGDRLKMELIGNELPKSSISLWDTTTTSIATRIENATEELEKLLSESTAEIDSGTAPPNIWEVIKALEVSSLELYTESAKQLNNERHTILIPCLALHSEACQLVQKAPGLLVQTQLGILSRVVATTRKLIGMQKSFLGPDHFDLARTNLDHANAIAELLSRSPRDLPTLPSLNSFQQWSAAEKESRKEYLRIKKLYPYDAENVVGDT